MADPFSFDFTVYWEDTDAGGIVDYANYLKFCERARTEWLRSAGFSQQRLLEEGTGFVVTQVACKYLSSARLDDRITVTCVPVKVRGLSLNVYQEVYNQRGEKLFEFECTLACMDMKRGRPQKMPQQVRDYIKAGVPEVPPVFEVRL